MSIFNGIQELQSVPTSFRFVKSDMMPAFMFSTHRSSEPFVFRGTSSQQMTIAPRRTPFSGRDFLHLPRGSTKDKLAKLRGKTLQGSGRLESVNLPQNGLGWVTEEVPHYAQPTVSTILKQRSKEGEYKFEDALDIEAEMLLQPALVPAGTRRVRRFTERGWSVEEVFRRINNMLGTDVLEEEDVGANCSSDEPVEVEQEAKEITGEGTNKGLRRGVTDKTALIAMKVSRQSGTGSDTCYVQPISQRILNEPDLDETLPLEHHQKDDEE